MHRNIARVRKNMHKQVFRYLPLGLYEICPGDNQSMVVSSNTIPIPNVNPET